MDYKQKVEKGKINTTLWQILDELKGSIRAPSDWSEEHDHYIHGTPKRG